MKKCLLFLVVLIGFHFFVSAQLAGDYRSVSSGIWNDATKWETYSGTNWVGTATYPGQNSGTGVVTVMNSTEITITASLPHPIASLQVDGDFNMLVPAGKLVFSSVGPVSLTVEGSVIIYGGLLIADQYNSKSHTLTIGGSLVVGTWIYVQDTTCIDFYPCPGIYNPFAGEIQTINHDDKLKVVFNTTMPNSSISGVGTVSFQDISFNGTGISLETSIQINGIASFVNGIVRASNYCAIGCAMDASGSSSCPPSSCALMFFADDATVSGASTASFVTGRVWKQGNDPFTFPIGDGGVYSPLTISAPNGQSEVFSARYVRSNADPSLWGVTDPGLYSVSNCEYWDLNYGYDNFGTFNDSYTGYIDVTVGWNPLSGCGSSYITNVPDVSLAHFNGTSWDSHGGSGSGTTTNGSITRSAVNNFGSFTLGNVNNSCVTPYGLTATNITSNSATLAWSPVPGSVNYDVDYKANTTNHWTNAATAIGSTLVNVAGLNPLVTYDWRVRVNCSSSSSAYRVNQFTTLNPCGTPSRLSTTNITSSSALLSWDPVPSGYNYTVQYKLSTEPSWPYNGIPVSSLSYSLSGLVPSTAYDWRVVAVCGPIDNVYYGSNAALASFTTVAPVVCDDFYEPNNTSGQAKAISLGTIISGMISSSADVDWFKVTMPNNSNTTLQAALSNSPADYDLYVYNKNLSLVGSSANTGTSNEVVIYNARQRNATYYIKVIGKNAAYAASQCYNLLAQAVGNAGSVTQSSSDFNNEITGASNSQLLYPNPASEFVQLSFNSIAEAKSDLQIVNNVGQLVKQYPVNIIKGYNQVKISVKDIIPGVYILKINRDGLSLMKRFVIAR